MEQIQKPTVFTSEDFKQPWSQINFKQMNIFFSTRSKVTYCDSHCSGSFVNSACSLTDKVQIALLILHLAAFVFISRFLQSYFWMTLKKSFFQSFLIFIEPFLLVKYLDCCCERPWIVIARFFPNRCKEQRVGF